MPTISVDTIVTIYHEQALREIGHSSIYTTEPHPGSGKIIEGWKWDERTWPTNEEFLAAAVAPSIWDPSILNIGEGLYQSGYGDNKDLLLLNVLDVQIGETNTWAPVVNHGYYYIRDQEWYLFSDAYLTEYFTGAQTFNTAEFGDQQYVDLTHHLKPTIPILVRTFGYDSFLGKYSVITEFRKVVEFTPAVDDPGPEFIVDDTFSPPRISLNGIYTEAIGVDPVDQGGGTFLSSEMNQLEIVGISDFSANQQYFTAFAPIDTTEIVSVFSWNDITTPQEWDIIDPGDDFATGESYEVKIDYDIGTLSFGNYDPTVPGSAGARPLQGTSIAIHYTSGVSVEYEPVNSIDHIWALGSNVNPVASFTNQGFVQVSTESVEPASISLSAELPQINPFLIELGNNIGTIVATVKSASGALLEGQEVTFNILAPQVGTFGTSSREISAITNSVGEARVLYNSPLTIEDLGRGTVTVSHDGADTVMDIAGLVDPGTVRGTYLYKVHEYDEALGILETPSDIVPDSYYDDYLADNNIVEDPDGTIATREFEEEFRATHDLLTPTLYSADDIKTGKKTIMLTRKTSGVINPNTGKEDLTGQVLSPLFPQTIEEVGTLEAPILRLRYNAVHLDLPTDPNDTKSYFAIGDAQTNMQARVINRRNNSSLNSNIIQLKVTIPDTVNGNYVIDSLSTLPDTLLDNLLKKTRNVEELSDTQIANLTPGSLDRSYNEERLLFVNGATKTPETFVEWFRRTRKGDTQTLTNASYGLVNVEPETPGPEPAEIPLGFRIRSSNVTVASLLDQITFLDPNDHLPDDYFNVESKIAAVGHKLEVI